MDRGGLATEVASENDALLPSTTDRTTDDENGGDGDDSPTTIKGSTLRLAAAGFDFWITGVVVAAIGVLIPEIEHYYGTDDATTAFIFPSSLFGYLMATALVEPIRTRLGLRGIAVVSPLLRISTALVIATGPPFPVLLAINVVFGLGSGLADMAWNNWASSMSRPNLAQGWLHGSFSLGCIVGPVMAVAVLKNHPWHVLYLVIAILAGTELFVQAFAFRKDSARVKNVVQTAEADPVVSTSALRSPLVWICALFFFIYQGIESVFTDWIVVYMQRVRHMDPSVAGLSSSVFWTGMALGRYLLGSISDRFGVRRSVAAYIIVAFIFQIGLGLVKNSIGSLVILGFNGFMIAPLYPSGIVILVSRLPKQSQLTAVAVAMGLGQMGAAVAPLGVGFMATHLGMQHLIEVVCVLSVMMLAAWAVFTR